MGQHANHTSQGSARFFRQLLLIKCIRRPKTVLSALHALRRLTFTRTSEVALIIFILLQSLQLYFITYKELWMINLALSKRKKKTKHHISTTRKHCVALYEAPQQRGRRHSDAPDKEQRHRAHVSRGWTIKPILVTKHFLSKTLYSHIFQVL